MIMRVRWIIISLAALAGIGFILVEASDAPIQVGSQGVTLTIQNVGSDPIKILDITVNERPDCTALVPWENASFDPAVLHRLWVYNFGFGRPIEQKGRIIDALPVPVLKSQYFPVHLAGARGRDKREREMI
jgi:hypothetical protein